MEKEEELHFLWVVQLSLTRMLQIWRNMMTEGEILVMKVKMSMMPHSHINIVNLCHSLQNDKF